MVNRSKIWSYVIVAAMALMVYLVPAVSHAVPASPDPVEVTQPDGTKFKAFIKGDEFQSWVETEKGHTVVKNPKTKKWEYGTKDKDGKLTPSGIVVIPGEEPPADIPKHIKPARNDGMNRGVTRDGTGNPDQRHK